MLVENVYYFSTDRCNGIEINARIDRGEGNDGVVLFSWSVRPFFDDIATVHKSNVSKQFLLVEVWEEFEMIALLCFVSILIDTQQKYKKQTHNLI